MDDDGRGFDATLAFLAEFQDVAVACSSPNGYSLPEPTTGCGSGHFYQRAVDATPDSTTSTAQKTHSQTSAAPKAKAPRKPRAKTIHSDDMTAFQLKPTKKKAVSETNVITETKKRRETVETVTTLKPLSKKDEIEFLREQVVELERTLHDLKRTGQVAGADGDASSVLVIPTARKTAKRTPSMWEELAMSQSNQRQSAQVENMKLKTKLEDQLKLAESLQRMLKRSKNEAALLHGKPSKSPG